MARGGKMFLIVFTLIIALATGLLFFSWLQTGSAKKETVVEKKQVEQVVVAKQDIAGQTCLTREMLEIKTLDSEGLPEGRFPQVEMVKGRMLLNNLNKQDVIVHVNLTASGMLCGVAAVLDPAKRAMAVRVDEVVGVAGFIKPGDHVDVLVTIPASKRIRDTITKTVIQNTRVLAIGTQMERQGQDGSPKKVSVMTLEVSPREAEKLALASTQGRLRLALRSPNNRDTVLTRGETAASLVRSYRKPVRAAKRKPKRSVELIKGSTTTKQRF